MRPSADFGGEKLPRLTKLVCGLKPRLPRLEDVEDGVDYLVQVYPTTATGAGPLKDLSVLWLPDRCLHLIGADDRIASDYTDQTLSKICSQVLSRRPNLVEDLRHERGLVLRQESPVVFGDHLGRVLDGVARLLVGAGDLEDMGRQNVADVVRSVRE